MAEQLMADILEIEEEEALIPVEVDPVLLMTDAQIKKEVEQLPPAQKALFEDVEKNCGRPRKRIRRMHAFGQNCVHC